MLAIRDRHRSQRVRPQADPPSASNSGISIPVRCFTKDRLFPLDLSVLCEALSTPTPPWTPSLPRQMMYATPLTVGRRHGRCGLAAEPGPREVRGGIPRNEIDETVLPSLTHETLKELGVTAVGHRLKLLDAIAALRADASIKAPLVASEPARQSGCDANWTADRGARRRAQTCHGDVLRPCGIDQHLCLA